MQLVIVGSSAHFHCYSVNMLEILFIDFINNLLSIFYMSDTVTQEATTITGKTWKKPHDNKMERLAKIQKESKC